VGRFDAELAQLAQEIERLGRPARDERETMSEPAAPELELDRARLAIEGTRLGPVRVGGQEQDRVLLGRAASTCHPRTLRPEGLHLVLLGRARG
jgi:hypothetical protein